MAGSDKSDQNSLEGSWVVIREVISRVTIYSPILGDL